VALWRPADQGIYLREQGIQSAYSTGAGNLAPSRSARRIAVERRLLLAESGIAASE
jgi:hypothetical protein